MIKKIIAAIMIMSSTAFGLEIIQTNNITFKGKMTIDTNTTFVDPGATAIDVFTNEPRKH